MCGCVVKLRYDDDDVDHNFINLTVEYIYHTGQHEK
jgi:hypothetical protein